MLLGVVVLRKRLTLAQLGGCALVVAGVCVAAWPTPGRASPMAGVSPFFAWVFVASMFFPALDAILKERLFAAFGWVGGWVGWMGGVCKAVDGAEGRHLRCLGS